MNNNLVQSELYRVWKNKRILFITLFFLFISIIDIYFVWYNSYLGPVAGGTNFKYELVPHPAFAAFLSGASEGHIGQMLIIWLLPIYLMFMMGDSYINERKYGYSSFRQSRIERNCMLKIDLIISFLFSFVMILLILLLNFILAVIIFHGGKNFNDLQTYVGTKYIGKVDSFQLMHPYNAYFVYTLMFSIITGLFSMICRAITWLVPNYAFVYPLSFFVWMIFIISPFNLGSLVQPFTGEFDLGKSLISGMLLLVVTITFVVSGYIKRARYDEI